jgi:hypothetical protein
MFVMLSATIDLCLIRQSSFGRRSSKRISRVPAEEVAPAEQVQPKRRRSSAQPTLGGPSRNPFKGAQTTVLEESEPEEDLPARKIGRSGKSVRL